MSTKRENVCLRFVARFFTATVWRQNWILPVIERAPESARLKHVRWRCRLSIWSVIQILGSRQKSFLESPVSSTSDLLWMARKSTRGAEIHFWEIKFYWGVIMLTVPIVNWSSSGLELLIGASSGGNFKMASCQLKLQLICCIGLCAHWACVCVCAAAGAACLCVCLCDHGCRARVSTQPLRVDICVYPISV